MSCSHRGGTLYLVAMSVLSLAGCTLRPALIEAHVKRVDEEEFIEVTVRSGDARTIERREVYFRIVVVDCSDHDDRFPMEARIAGRAASKFDFPIASEFVTFHGSMPSHVLREFPRPCVALQGGSYLFVKLDSEAIPLVRRVE